MYDIPPTRHFLAFLGAKYHHYHDTLLQSLVQKCQSSGQIMAQCTTLPFLSLLPCPFLLPSKHHTNFPPEMGTGVKRRNTFHYTGT